MLTSSIACSATLVFAFLRCLNVWPGNEASLAPFLHSLTSRATRSSSSMTGGDEMLSCRRSYPRCSGERLRSRPPFGSLFPCTPEVDASSSEEEEEEVSVSSENLAFDTGFRTFRVVCDIGTSSSSPEYTAAVTAAACLCLLLLAAWNSRTHLSMVGAMCGS